MKQQDLDDLLALLDHSVRVEENHVEVKDPVRLRATIHRLAEVSALESGPRQGLSRYLVRLIAQKIGVYPASINDLYMAIGRGDVPASFTVPAVNLRAMAFDSARAAFKAARPIDAAAMIFEIARSEMGYTDQRPAEYVTSVLAAAVAEGYTGPVFIQGDHFQVSAKRFATGKEAELQAVKDLIVEALAAGFFNIDIDTSTLVDIDKPTIAEQQVLNTSLSAMYTAYIRAHEPKGLTVSVGGEIGEVGGHNSTPEELCGYMEGYNAELKKLAPEAVGISKISIQTGTSHGGVVLPDGSIAKANVDFETLEKLSQIGRKEFGIGGAVQHGASTLPDEAFSKFVQHKAVEVHLATNFQTMLFERLPEDLLKATNAYLDEKFGAERKPGMTDEQFYHKMRKNAVGPFKKQVWNLPAAKKDEIVSAWEAQFSKLFASLNLKGTRKYVEQTIKPVPVKPSLAFYLGEAAEAGDVSDLAD